MEGTETNVAETKYGLAADEFAKIEQMAFPGNGSLAQPFPVTTQPPTTTQPQPEVTTTTVEVTTQADPNEQAVDANVFLKEQLGYEDWEAAKAEIAELKKLREAPKSDGLKWGEALTDEMEDAIYRQLHSKQQIKGVDNLNDEQKLKLYIKLQNPLFDEELVDDEYLSLYKVDENKFKNEVTDEIDSLGLRKEKLRTAQRVQNDVNKANEFFNQYKTKIELPKIQTEQPDLSKYQELEASMQNDLKVHAEQIAPAIQSLKETDLLMNFQIDDEKSQMKFDSKIEVTKEDLEQAKNDAIEFGSFLNSGFYDPSGKFKSADFTKMILLYKNIGKYVNSIQRQAVNAERARVVGRSTEGGNSYARDYNIEANDYLKQMEHFAFQGK